MTRFWVGGYGPDMDGTAPGIGYLSVTGDGGPSTLAYREVATATDSPSWLAAHPTLDVVYAALEAKGTVAAFRRVGETSLEALGDPLEAGAAVCHLAVAADGRSLIASSYGDGTVTRFGLGGDGRLMMAPVDGAAALRAALFGEDEDGPGDTASDPYPSPPGDEPRVSRAHAAAFLPSGRVATTDLGFDLVRIWRSGAHGLVHDHDVTLPHGTGPRHLVYHPSGHLHVVTEYSGEVFTLAAFPDDRWRLVAGTPVAELFRVGTDFPAELSRSRDGATLYAGIRGSNTIAALRVHGDGSRVEPLALADSGVDWPRYHLLYEGVLLVAGQHSNTVSAVDVDDRTGVPRAVRHTTAVPSPTHLLPAI